MSQEIDLCRDSDDDGEQPNTASVPSLPLSRKRPRDKEESSNDAHPRNENGPGNKTGTGSAKFVVDLERADKVETVVSPHRTRRAVEKSELTAKNDVARKCAQILKEVHATERDVGSEDAEVADHCESHEGVAAAAAASHQMNMDEASMPADEASVPMETESSNDTSTATSTTAGRSMSGTLSRKVAKRTYPWWPAAAEPLALPTPIDGDGDIPVPVAKKPRREVPLLETTEEATKISSPDAEKAALLPADVDLMTAVSHPMNSDSEQTSRDYGSANTHSQTLSTSKPPPCTLGREWRVPAWEDRLSELADYRKIHGHCNVPQNYSKNKLGSWVAHQRTKYRLHKEGKTSPMTTFRIQKLEIIGLEWRVGDSVW
jgi:hypothetical protein